VKVLESQDDFNSEKERDIVGESTFSSKKSEKLASTCVIKEHKDVSGRLEGTLQVHDVWVVDSFEDGLL